MVLENDRWFHSDGTRRPLHGSDPTDVSEGATTAVLGWTFTVDDLLETHEHRADILGTTTLGPGMRLVGRTAFREFPYIGIHCDVRRRLLQNLHRSLVAIHVRIPAPPRIPSDYPGRIYDWSWCGAPLRDTDDLELPLG